jgi:His-Xaa-Ser system radical SAM maturase HxsC
MGERPGDDIMIPLSAHGKAVNVGPLVIGKITRSPVFSNREDYVLAVDELSQGADTAGYGALLAQAPVTVDAPPEPFIHDVPLGHLNDGDVVSVDRRGHVRTLYRPASRSNALFVTDRCNSYCLMCSQPPKNVEEPGRLQELQRIVSLVNPDAAELGITGGEPTLLRNEFIELIRTCRDRLPNTALHVLSNGRLFYYGSFAKKLADLRHPDLMIGVPLYADNDSEHDHVVQARGAFDETMIGLQNLGKYGVPVEIRVVIHQHTYKRLPELAEFIYRNVTFASQVALMGLELMGFAIPNLESLWVDPWDYRKELEAATRFLSARGMKVSIYNHQLCTVPEVIWPLCRRSISDWKNEYLPVCDKCQVRHQCGGFFTSVVQRRTSNHIVPIESSATVE